jgi:hypothetical protein
MKKVKVGDCRSNVDSLPMSAWQSSAHARARGLGKQRYLETDLRSVADPGGGDAGMHPPTSLILSYMQAYTGGLVLQLWCLYDIGYGA